MYSCFLKATWKNAVTKHKCNFSVITFNHFVVFRNRSYWESYVIHVAKNFLALCETEVSLPCLLCPHCWILSRTTRMKSRSSKNCIYYLLLQPSNLRFRKLFLPSKAINKYMANCQKRKSITYKFILISPPLYTAIVYASAVLA